ncbi:MAG: sugar phosphate isomerase/epimerase family protein [Bacteroidota bacterium]
MRKLILLLSLLLIINSNFAQKIKLKPEIGIAESIDNDQINHEAGFSCIVENLGKLISPRSVTDEQFGKNLVLFKNLKTPIYAFNIFIPGELKVIGPKVDEVAILEYVENVMKRLSQTDTKMIVWGSGGSRRLPEGFDREVATNQFISIAKKIARVAKKYDIVICLESLNSTETNFINTTKESLYVVKKVNHPNLRLNVDFYHMLKEGESPEIIAKTKKYIGHVEIAERDGRTAPGVAGTDFRPYLKELAKINYHQKIVIEGRWKSLPEIAKMTKVFLQNQIDEVYN